MKLPANYKPEKQKNSITENFLLSLGFIKNGDWTIDSRIIGGIYILTIPNKITLLIRLPNNKFKGSYNCIVHTTEPIHTIGEYAHCRSFLLNQIIRLSMVCSKVSLSRDISSLLNPENHMIL